MSINSIIILSLQYSKLNEEEKVIANYVLLVAAFLMVIFFIGRLFYFFEMAYVEYINKKLFFNHVYFRKKKLTNSQKSLLNKNFKFYQRLSIKHQSYFEHRVYKIISETEFIGKDIDVTEEMKLVLSATLTKLTFGLRDYNIESVERIIFYPEAFYSQTNKTYHKGEFNLGLRALVLSWKDVLHGYEIEDDNLNLAVHEFTHAIHFYYMKVRRSSTSAAIFLDAFVELTTMLDNDQKLKTRLVDSNFLRDYAYTNQFEFISVIVETFIESPQDFRSNFPLIYNKVKTMLGFNFAGY
ncbi:zinc-dependent peptidase [Psychroserpens damuponensis]|uniref:zinc-dependent peptidase n=1 Tax=Psychroserpens damuponensis TaxID=943936 RepID=UPI0006949463|nr:zinc-dependent peptidase [Psychroserpens damuponensis]